MWPRRSSSARARAGAVIRLLRPSHWMKNGFVLAPLLFNVPGVSPKAAVFAVAAAAAFCLASSAVYAFNDILDRQSDARCPMKRHRPLASGEIGAAEAWAATAACALGAAAISAACLPPAAGYALAAYAALNVAYTLVLKRLVILDVIALSAGFILRVAAGGAAVGVTVSAWMLLTVFFLSLFLGFSKRGAEVRSARRGSARAVLSSYSRAFLATLIPICVGITIVMYALSLITPITASRSGGDALLCTVPVVAYGLLRYLWLTMRAGRGEEAPRGADAADVVARDLPLVLTVLLWGLLVVTMAVIRA